MHDDFKEKFQFLGSSTAKIDVGKRETDNGTRWYRKATLNFIDEQGKEYFLFVKWSTSKYPELIEYNVNLKKPEKK